MTKACNQSILDQLVYSAATKRYIYGNVIKYTWQILTDIWKNGNLPYHEEQRENS